MEVRTTRSPSGPAQALSTHHLPICTAWDSNPKEGGGDQPECDQQTPGPGPGPGQAGSYLHCVVICSRRQPLPVGAEPETPHGLAVPLGRTEHRAHPWGLAQGLPSPPPHATPAFDKQCILRCRQRGKTCRRRHRGALPRGTMDSQACRGSRKSRCMVRVLCLFLELNAPSSCQRV